MGWLLVLIGVVLAYVTVQKKWFYDPTHPNNPKKTRASRWFRSKS
ncbi:hypothetical protein [Aneurinibacillus sp. REN35]